MALTFHYHPLASFCHKVLIALYEKEIAFEPVIVDLGNPDVVAEFRKISPMAKMPVLVDGDLVVRETTVILEYLDRRYPTPKLIPSDERLELEARTWDRFFDFHVEIPMSAIVGDRLRPEGKSDPFGVERCYDQLRQVYAVVERHMAGREWLVGDTLTIADCSAEPGLFYANTMAPMGADFPHAAAYLLRLMHRPTVTRVLKEAAPYFNMFPMPVKPDISMLT